MQFGQIGGAATNNLFYKINGVLYPALGYAPAIWADTVAMNNSALNIKNIPLFQASDAAGKNWYRNIGLTAWVEFGAGSGVGITALTGDGTATGPGSVPLTLATVNGNVGTFGSATQSAQVTFNAKGLATAVSNVTITPAASSITGGAALSKTDDTNVTLTLGGTPLTSLLQATSITAGWTGQLAIARGGTGAATTSQNFAFIGPTSGSGVPSFRALVAGDLPDLNATAWKLTGNSGTTPGTNFIGTTDGQGLMFKIAGVQAGYLDYSNANVSFGSSALIANTIGVNNVYIGEQAGVNGLNHRRSVGIGAYTQGGTSSDANTSVGAYSLGVNTGDANTAVGTNALLVNTSGFKNVAIGAGALEDNTQGFENTFVGMDAGLNITTGDVNNGVGWLAGSGNILGNQNNYFGTSAGRSQTSGDNNIFIGHEAGFSGSQLAGINNSIAIGQGVFTEADNQIRIGNASHTQTWLRGLLYFDGVTGIAAQSIRVNAGATGMEYYTPSTVATTMPISGLRAATAQNAITWAGYSQIWELTGTLSAGVGFSIQNTTTASANSDHVFEVISQGVNASSGVGKTSLYVRALNSGTGSANVGISVGAANGATNTAIEVTTGNVLISPLTASQAVFTDANKNLVSNAISGSGNVAMTTSPLFATPRLNSTSTTGYVWTATDGSGNGSFQAAAGGSGLTVGTTTITSGTDTRVPFNDAGVYGEDAGLTYNKTTDILTVGGGAIVGGNSLFGAGTAVSSASNVIVTIRANADNTSRLFLQNQTDGGGISAGFSISQSSGITYLNNNQNGAMIFYTNATERWNIQAAGHLVAGTDNTYDIGAAAATRPRDLHLGRNALIAGTMGITGVTTLGAPVILKAYTVATLPAGTIGMVAYVTDALAPAFLATVVGGGAIVTPVFYNGSNWIAN